MTAERDNGRILEVDDLAAGYGARRVIEGISFTAGPGEIIAVIGPNGSGKSTLLKALLGLIRVHGGRVTYRDEAITSLPTHRRIARGMVYLPQGNRVFGDLTVRENLLLGGYILPPREAARRVDEVLPMFPRLEMMLKRPADTLSGGERQMVAFARGMILKPRLLMLDEPSVGLSPKLVGESLDEISRLRAETGCCMLVVEQKVDQVLGIAGRVLALKMGRLEFDGTPGEAREQAKRLFLV